MTEVVDTYTYMKDSVAPGFALAHCSNLNSEPEDGRSSLSASPSLCKSSNKNKYLKAGGQGLDLGAHYKINENLRHFLLQILIVEAGDDTVTLCQLLL